MYRSHQHLVGHFSLAALTGLSFLCLPAVAQQYWEYEGDELERHEPRAGYEYEYDWEDGWELDDIEAERYEYEPGEGYHEQEWYDPSDWFSVGPDFDYEANGWDHGYYDYDDYYGYGDYDYDDYYDYDYDYGYDYDPYLDDDFMYDEDDYEYGWHRDAMTGTWQFGWHYDPYDPAVNWDYGWHWDGWADGWEYGYHREPFDYGYDVYDYDPFERDHVTNLVDDDYDFDRQFRAEVVGLERMRVRDGRAETVRLRVRTDDGKVRTVQLGDYAYVRKNLPTLRKGDRIRIAGNMMRQDGQRRFKALQVRTADGRFTIPDYRYDRVLTGRLAGLKAVKTEEGDVRGVVAKVKTRQGDTVNVVFGSRDALQKKARIRPGDQVRVAGFSRSLNGYTTFFAEDLDVRQRSDQRQNRQRQQ